MDISGKTLLVTGGGSGLGEATVREIVQAGGRAVIADVNAETSEALAAELGENARFAQCDVTDEAAVQGAVSVAREAFGGLHGAVNCAGVPSAQRVLSRSGPHSLGAFSTVLNINLTGTFNVIRLATAAMADQEPTETGERGVIINTASIAAYEGQIGQAAYAASKGGVVAMTLPIARELARFAIRVVTIVPGIFDTPMMALLPDAVKESLAGQVPYPQRLGRASEFAALARHVLENEMINGTCIRLDGAIRMGPK